MSEETSLDLVLGFIGDQTVHPANARALLTDLIGAHRRTNKDARVRFVVPVEPFTETLEELAEFCLESDFKLELIGHARALADQKIGRYADNADMVIEVPGDRTIASALIERLIAPLHVRIILLADPNEDDVAYYVVEKANEKTFTVRTLLNGLDMVNLEPKQKEKPEVARASEIDEDEYEDEDEDLDDEELEDLEEEDEDLTDDDDDEEEDDEEEDEDEEPEPAPRVRRKARVVDEDDEDEEDLEDEDLDEEDDEEEEPAPRPRVKSKSKVAKKSTKSSDDAPKKWTMSSLSKLEKEDLYAVGAEFGVLPGRGMKMSTMITRILTEQDGEAPAVAPKAATKPAVKKSATVKPQSVKASSSKVESTAVAAAGDIDVNPLVAQVLTNLGTAFLDLAKTL